MSVPVIVEVLTKNDTADGMIEWRVGVMVGVTDTSTKAANIAKIFMAKNTAIAVKEHLAGDLVGVDGRTGDGRR